MFTRLFIVISALLLYPTVSKRGSALSSVCTCDDICDVPGGSAEPHGRCSPDPLRYLSLACGCDCSQLMYKLIVIIAAVMPIILALRALVGRSQKASRVFSDFKK